MVAAAATIVLLLPHTAMSVTLPEEVIAERDLTTHISAVAAAIKEAEGRCAKGQSGESGCYQYLPATWRQYSIEATGEVLPHTAENEDTVTEGMVRKWLALGKSERWIFLTWNQGNGDGWGPGAKDCYAGTNKWGVAYDSCDYARRATASLARIEAPERLPDQTAGPTSKVVP